MGRDRQTGHVLYHNRAMMDKTLRAALHGPGIPVRVVGHWITS
jgi:hypothetical protein